MSFLPPVASFFINTHSDNHSAGVHHTVWRDLEWVCRWVLYYFDQLFGHASQTCLNSSIFVIHHASQGVLNCVTNSDFIENINKKYLKIPIFLHVAFVLLLDFASMYLHWNWSKILLEWAKNGSKWTNFFFHHTQIWGLNTVNWRWKSSRVTPTEQLIEIVQ